jgi:hypothetical protein
MLIYGWIGIEQFLEKATDTMTTKTTTQWQTFLNTAKAKYAMAGDAYQTALNDANATMESLTTAQATYDAAGTQWTADQHTANMMAAEAAYTTAAADYATCNLNPTTPGETFGIAWGADGEVLTFEQTIEAIATRKGWYNWRGHWVNTARIEKEACAMVASK